MTEGKVIGTITIQVLDNRQTKATFKGEIPPNAIFTSRMTLQRDYAQHMSTVALGNRRKQKELDRVQKVKDNEQARKDLEAQQLKEKLALEKAQKGKVEIPAPSEPAKVTPPVTPTQPKVEDKK